ncbi:hypothetical protein [Mycobacterium sp. GA-1841]|uniref:hypothetical protein n=1 Tax=Mycobacterium sp. GA-1841 TaxID=1834154 RepID=UPI001588786B|nr:hypothetical protein [Mycobacterium sp. GA-1841]
MTEKFIRGNDRLNKMLADPETRAAVDAIVDEMDRADRVHALAEEIAETSTGLIRRLA